MQTVCLCMNQYIKLKKKPAQFECITTTSLVLSKKLQESMMSGEWLTDEHISAAQRLLKYQFSHVGGLQSPLLAETNGFESVPSLGVQIHYCKTSLGHF